MPACIAGHTLRWNLLLESRRLIAPGRRNDVMAKARASAKGGERGSHAPQAPRDALPAASPELRLVPFAPRGRSGETGRRFHTGSAVRDLPRRAGRGDRGRSGVRPQRPHLAAEPPFLRSGRTASGRTPESSRGRGRGEPCGPNRGDRAHGPSRGARGRPRTLPGPLPGARTGGLPGCGRRARLQPRLRPRAGGSAGGMRAGGRRSLQQREGLGLLGRAGAVLLDRGGVSGPAARRARELRLPAIFGLEDATSRLAGGTEVTVDADENVVYEGRIAELLDYYHSTRLATEEEPEYALLRSVRRAAFSLTLAADPTEPRLAECRTVHDLVFLARSLAGDAMAELLATSCPDVGEEAPSPGPPRSRSASHASSSSRIATRRARLDRPPLPRVRSAPISRASGTARVPRLRGASLRPARSMPSRPPSTRSRRSHGAADSTCSTRRWPAPRKPTVSTAASRHGAKPTRTGPAGRLPERCWSVSASKWRGQGVR